MKMFGRFDDLEINIRRCITKAQIGPTKMVATWASGAPDENQMCPLIQELVQGILNRVRDGQTLQSAIRSMDTSFGSTVLKLQQYVAAEHPVGHAAPDLCTKISQEEYEELVKNYKEKIEVYTGDDGFQIHYELRYGCEPGRNRELFYSGFCEVSDSRLRRISRRENRKNRNGFLSRLFAH